MRFLSRRRRREEELNKEIESHLQMATTERLERGEAVDQAAISARRELGNVVLIREFTRSTWGLLWLERVSQDVRYGLRVLRKSPLFTVMAVLTLALGIGANTTIFTLVNAFVLRPLAVSDPASLFSVASVRSEGPGLGTFSYPNYLDIRDRNNVLSGISARTFVPMSVTFAGQTERVIGNLVTSNYFDVLGVKAAIGRTFLEEEDKTEGSHPVVVISYGCWQRRFGADPSIVGRQIVLNKHDFTVIGIAPAGFTGSEVAFAPDFWAPSMMEPWFTPTALSMRERDYAKWFLVGRLKPGVTPTHAEANLKAILSELGREFPDVNEGLKVQLTPPGFLIPAARVPALGFAGLLMTTVGIVLLIACANLAGLLLARMTDRRREIAIRLALGAGRKRIIGQLLTESLLLSVAGGGLGLLLAVWLSSFVASVLPKLPFYVTLDLNPDFRVLTFTMVVSLATGMLFGLLPALQSTKTDLIPALKNESSFAGGSKSRLRNWFIVAQVTMSFVLLITAGMIVSGLRRAQQVGPGFEIEHAVILSVDVIGQGYSKAKGREFYKQIISNIESIAGVKSVSLTSYLPLSLDYYGDEILVEGQPEVRGAQRPEAMKCSIAPGYFSTMAIPILDGRDFTANDTAESVMVAIVNETFAHRFWPGQNAIGKRFKNGLGGQMISIVGIAKDSKYFNLSEEPRTFFYRPIQQAYLGEATLIVRTSAEPDIMMAAVIQKVKQLDATVPTYDLKTLSEHMRISTFPLRVGADGVGTFGLLALVLAVIGIYGGTAYAVSQRTKEIGIRIAIGASRSSIFSLIVKQGMAMVSLGLGIGLIISVIVSRLIASVIYGVDGTDFATFGTVTALFILIVFAACCIPARRATRVDPMVALRYE